MKKFSNNEIKIESVQKIFEKVISSIDSSRNQIIDIVNDSRKEYETLKMELDIIGEKINKAIDLVDLLEVKEKLARNNLAIVSKNFKSNTEEDIKAAYEKAMEIRVEHKSAQHAEHSIREQRSRLELAIKNAIRKIKKAEQVVHQVTIASSYLRGEILNAIEEVNSNSDMILGVRILEAQENERTRLSRDIHDGPAQSVANIVMKADLCEKIAKKDIEMGLIELNELKASAREALKDIRNIIYNLRPMSLDDLGLSKTIEMNAKSIFENLEVKLDFKFMKMNVEVEKIIQVAVFRIVQEILNNIKKHAKAKSIFITIEYGIKYLRVIIGDDGVGFDYNSIIEKVKREKKSYGLIGIHERVEQLHGEIKVDSEIGNGTIYTIKLPISRKVIQDE